MLEPDATTRPAPVGAPGSGLASNPHVLQILMTEHWSLLGARSLVYTEAMSRTAIFVASLTGSVVASTGWASDRLRNGLRRVRARVVASRVLPRGRDRRPTGTGQLGRCGLGSGHEQDPARLPRDRTRTRAVLRHEQIRRRTGRPPVFGRDARVSAEDPAVRRRPRSCGGHRLGCRGRDRWDRSNRAGLGHGRCARARRRSISRLVVGLLRVWPTGDREGADRHDPMFPAPSSDEAG